MAFKMESLILLHKVLFIILNLKLCIGSDTRAKYTYSTTVAQPSVYMTFQGITILSCEKACKIRQDCKAAIYEKMFQFCSLLPANVSGHQPSIRKGSVLLEAFDELRMKDPLCGTENCTEHEACVVVNNNPKCKVTECGIPVVRTAVEEIFGNIYTIGSRLLIRYKLWSSSVRYICRNNGLWIEEVQELTDDCSDVTGPSGVYLHRTNRTPVYCDMVTDGGRWMVFQRRLNDSVNFQRNWSDYSAGFGLLDGDFWLGLQFMYEILSSGDYELRIELKNSQGDHVMTYDTFAISGPADDYRLHISGFSGEADGMSILDGVAFSTMDRDNDLDTGLDCAKRCLGAWWYKVISRLFCCIFSSNLNGKYYLYNNIFYGWSNVSYVKETEMKFRRQIEQ